MSDNKVTNSRCTGPSNSMKSKSLRDSCYDLETLARTASIGIERSRVKGETMKMIEHVYLDLYIDFDDDGACLRFGPDLPFDEIPVDGEIIRVGGRLYKVGTMDSSDPPILFQVKAGEEHEYEEDDIWWDADDPNSIAAGSEGDEE